MARWVAGSSPATSESCATGIFASGSATIMGTKVPWSYPRFSSRPVVKPAPRSSSSTRRATSGEPGAGQRSVYVSGGKP